MVAMIPFFRSIGEYRCFRLGSGRFASTQKIADGERCAGRSGEGGVRAERWGGTGALHRAARPAAAAPRPAAHPRTRLLQVCACLDQFCSCQFMCWCDAIRSAVAG